LDQTKFESKNPGTSVATLGSDPAVQEIQLRRVKKYWDTGDRDANRFHLKTEAGIALCFDIAVQNGGIDNDTEARRILTWINDNPGASERDVLVRIADVVAENSRRQYVEDVRKRKEQSRKATVGSTARVTQHGLGNLRPCLLAIEIAKRSSGGRAIRICRRERAT
jgi:hypothetical protein